MLKDSSDINSNIHESADVVVIGSGAGGAPIARELSVAGKKIILIEEGKNFSSRDFNRDGIDMMFKMYRESGTTVTIGTPAVVLPIGVTLGGTTTVNSGTCFRIPEDLLQKWQDEFGLKEITKEKLDPYFKRVEDIIHVEEVDWDTMGANNQLFAKGAKALGYSGSPLKRNQKNCVGSGICALGCPEDAKQAMHLNYLPQASNAGAVIYTQCRAEKIFIKDNRATGIEGRFLDPESKKPRDIKIRVDANVVILAGGTLYSPVLLLKNKIGNYSGQVGRNLRVHPCCRLMALFDREINSWSGCPQSYCVDQFKDEGIIFEGFFIPPSLMAFILPSFGERLKDLMAQYNKLAGFGVMVSDTSAGRVIRGIGGRPLALYNLNKQDTLAFQKGIAIASDIYFEAGAEKVFTPIHGIEELNSKDEIKKIYEKKLRPKDLTELMGFHPMGTCRMGIDRKNSVVNSNLEAHDIKHLFIVDASVFPTSLGVNPQETIMAFSTMTADYLLNNEKRYFA